MWLDGQSLVEGADVWDFSLPFFLWYTLCDGFAIHCLDV